MTGEVKHVDVRSRSESESGQGVQLVAVDAKLGDLPMARLKVW